MANWESNASSVLVGLQERRARFAYALDLPTRSICLRARFAYTLRRAAWGKALGTAPQEEALTAVAGLESAARVLKPECLDPLPLERRNPLPPVAQDAFRARQSVIARGRQQVSFEELRGRRT